MKTVFVKESKNAGYTVLGIDAGEGARTYTVPTALYMQIGSPLSSEILGDEAYSKLAHADEVFRATKKALFLLAYSDNNTRTLAAKLGRAGFSAPAVRECIADMLRHGYINEERQLERLILAEVKLRLCGRAKFTPKLMAKGYKRADIDRVTDALIAEEKLDFEEVKRELVRKKLGDAPNAAEVKKLLYKNGFYSD